MKTSTKVILILSAALFFSGIAMVCVFSALGGSFDTQGLQEKTYDIQGSVADVSVTLRGADFLLEPSPDGTVQVVCHESERVTYTVENTDGTLRIVENDNRKWYEFIGISLKSRNVTLYLPTGNYGNLDVETSSGRIRCWEGFTFENTDLTASSGAIECNAAVIKNLQVKLSSGQIQVKNASAQTVKLSSSSGRIVFSDSQPSLVEITTSSGAIRVRDVNCSTLIAHATSGAVTLDCTVAQRTLCAKTSSGAIRLQKCDAPSLDLEATSGLISATLLSGKRYNVKTGSGSAKYPSSNPDGGVCNVATTSGNVNIYVVP